MKRIFIFPHGIWKDNIRSVILDWRQWSTGRSSEQDRHTSHSSRPASSLCVFSSRRTTSQKGSLSQKRICANSLWQYSYYTQSSASKNENINYIFIHQRDFCCLSSGAICNSFINELQQKCKYFRRSWEKSWQRVFIIVRILMSYIGIQFFEFRSNVSTIVGNLMPKLSLKRNISGTIWPILRRIR